MRNVSLKVLVKSLKFLFKKGYEPWGNNCLVIVDHAVMLLSLHGFFKIKRCFLLRIMLMNDEPLLSGQAL